MPPPPVFNDLLKAVTYDKPGSKLFLAAATSMNLQNKDESNSGVTGIRKLSRQAKLLRTNAFTQAVALTYLEEAAGIFGYGQEQLESFQGDVVEIRDLLESYLNNPKQEANPSSFGGKFEQVELAFPQFLASAMRRTIYIQSESEQGSLSLLRMDGFASLTKQEFTSLPIIIKMNVRSYEGIRIQEGYEDLMHNLEQRVQAEDILIPVSVQEEAVKVTHYLQGHTATREFT